MKFGSNAKIFTLSTRDGSLYAKDMAINHQLIQGILKGEVSLYH